MDNQPGYGTTYLTSPGFGANITSLPFISGVRDPKIAVSSLNVILTRDRDGKSWDGSSWGGTGSTLLPVTDTGNLTWQTSGPMPSGNSLSTGLLEGYYMIQFSFPTGGTIYHPFSVGNLPPPVTTIPYSWGYNGNGALGAGPGPSQNAVTKVLTTGELAGKVVVNVVSGAEHSLALTSDGTVYAWGYNGFGQLARGDTSLPPGPITSPLDVPTAIFNTTVTETFIAIGTGDYHSLAVTRNGRILAWGNNSNGQLGSGSASFTPVASPRYLSANFLPGGRRTATVSAGMDYSMALAQDGTLYAWGANANGQLGDGTNTARLAPVAVSLSGKIITKVDAGHDHALALTSDGQLYSWGLGTNGLLGTGSNASSNLPVRVGLTGPMAGKTVVDMSASRYHSLALTSDGKVYAWGSNAFHGLGDGGVLASSNVPIEVGGLLSGKRSTRIAAGWSSNFAITSDAKMFAWGDNSDGNLCGANGFGAVAAAPTEAPVSSAITPYNIPAVIDTGWKHSILLTASGPGPVPDLVVESRGGVLTNGSEFIVGTDAIGVTSTAEITVRNRGSGDLLNLALSSTGSAFSVGTLSANRLSPGQSLKFTVSFSSNTSGAFAGSLQLLSSDGTDGTFTLPLSGIAKPYGAIDTTFANTNVTGVVNAMALQTDHRILIGGSFSAVTGSTRNNLARLNADGTLDTTFNPNVNGVINGIGVQRDGKILIAGGFTTVGITTRNRLARLNADGSLDTTFNPNVNATINALHVEPNGSLFIGGTFTLVGASSPPYLAKLTAAGAVDSSFAPQLNGPVRCLALQDDGFVLIGGTFSTVGTSSRDRLARVETDGHVDPDFVADVTGLGGVSAIVALPDGRILVGGSFLELNHVTRGRIARLSINGVVDTTFPAIVNDSEGSGASITSMARFANGKVFLTGSFSLFNGSAAGSMARMNADGTRDGSFTTGAGGSVNGALIQDDGKLLVGGDFSAIGGTTRNGFARLTAQTVTQTVDTLSFPGVVNWFHGAGFPATEQATLESSIDNGVTWTSFGNGVRLTSPQVGWTWFNPSLPTGKLRLRATQSGGLNNGSNSVVEIIQTYATPPQLRVSLGGNILVNGSTVPVAPTRVGGNALLQFTVTNIGGTRMTGIMNTDVTNSTAFDATTPLDDNLEPGASTTLFVAYHPRSVGDQSGLLGFNTNSSSPLFAVILAGSGGQPIENWRQTYFGSPLDSGPGANSQDADHDGRSNLLEYAIGTLPGVSDKDASFFQVSNGVIYFIYQRSKAAMADVSYQVEYTNNLSGPWTSDQVGEGVVLSDNGIIQMVQTIVPQSTSPKRFARLRVTTLAP